MVFGLSGTELAQDPLSSRERLECRVYSMQGIGLTCVTQDPESWKHGGVKGPLEPGKISGMPHSKACSHSTTHHVRA